MLKNANSYFNLCVCYIYPIHTCITQSTVTRKIILFNILLPLTFAVLRWLAWVNSGLYRRYTSWINTDKTKWVTSSHSPMISLSFFEGSTRAISFVVYIYGRLFVLTFKPTSSFCKTTVGRNCLFFLNVHKESPKWYRAYCHFKIQGYS